MYSFDASSMIHAWDTYPIENEHFDSFWNWFSEKVEGKEFTASKVALDEVTLKIPECGRWLRDNHIESHPLTTAALVDAQRIKGLLDIEEENYGTGVGENDLLIIAIARELNLVLVTEERRQNTLPLVKANYKIPAVCSLPAVNVECKYFIELIK